jgi:hypothetical protein
MTKKETLMFALAAMVGCQNAKSGGGGTVKFTASGEVLALGGYAFPPAKEGDPFFVDGWQIDFDELLVTLDNITLSENPDKSPTDQSKTDKAVARAHGPWAVDLHKGGPLPGKGGSDEQAVAIATLQNQNLNGGEPFDDTMRYAFGFEIVAASSAAKQINLNAQGKDDYATMVERRWTVFYSGTATFNGKDCTSTDASYDFTKLPGAVKFKLGFKSPTSYINCQNPDNDPAGALGGEEHQRGVQIKANTATVAQATVHTDHPFWESVQHDSPAHFDPLAGHANEVNGEFVVTMDDVSGVDFTAFKDEWGKPMPWRSCDSSYTPPDNAPVMHYDTQGVPYDPSGDPKRALRDFLDYLTYNQSTQGHLNSDGLCYVKRNYPSPR